MPMLPKKIFVCLLFLMFISVTVTSSISANSITAIPTATVTVSPTTIVGPQPDINDTFKIYVNVINVTGLAGYSIGMRWNSTVLNCTNVAYNHTFITGIPIEGEINNTKGEFSPYSIASYTGTVTGNGTLLDVSFKVKAYGETPLNLTIDGLQNSTLEEIPRTVINGTFSLPTPDEEDPVIGNPEQDPETNVTPDQAVTVSVNVTDNDEVQTVILSYSNDTGTTWYNVTMNNTSGNLWEEDIPAHPAGTGIQYKIFAYDMSNNSAEKDNAGEYYVYTVIPEFPIALIVPMLIALLAVTVLAKKLRPRN